MTTICFAGDVACGVRARDSFLFNWLDLLAFSLSGLKAEGTSCAAMAYVMADLHREGAKLGGWVGGWVGGSVGFPRVSDEEAFCDGGSPR